MTTLAEKLKTVGYNSVLIGKTHWGVATDLHLPINRGWDSHIGYLGGGEAYWSGHECVNESTNCHIFTDQMDMWHDRGPATEADLLGRYSTLLFTRLAVATVNNRSRALAAAAPGLLRSPLWLHVNYQSVHNPQTTPPGQSTKNNDASQVFYQVLQEMDHGIANITRALKDAGMWNTTLVLFLSDNGAASNGNNYPLRGGK